MRSRLGPAALLAAALGAAQASPSQTVTPTLPGPSPNISAPPSASPSPGPSASPAGALAPPSASPSASPSTALPSTSPSTSPFASPSASQLTSSSPSASPSAAPSAFPSSAAPSRPPTAAPSGTAAPSVPPPTPGARRFVLRAQFGIRREELQLSRLKGRLVTLINRLSSGELDMQVVATGCATCRFCEPSNIRLLCWRWVGEDTCADDIPASRRAEAAQDSGGTQNATADGQLELVGAADPARVAWLAALRRSEADAVADPYLRMQAGTLVVEDTANTTLVQNSADGGDDGLPWWAAVVIACGGVLLLLLAGYLWYRHKQGASADRERGKPAPTEPGTPVKRGSSGQRLAPDTPERHAMVALPNGTPDPDARRPSVNPIDAAFLPVAPPAPPPATSPGPASPASLPPPTVLGFGRNLEGQLGLGETETQTIPMEISGFRGAEVSLVAAGSFHSFIVLREGPVFAFGEGGDGQLGLGNQQTMGRPTHVAALHGKHVREIACGEQHTLFLCDDGVFVCGKNDDGQLGLPHRVDHLAPEPLPLCGADPLAVSRVAAGSHHSCLILAGRLYACGWNRMGQLGTGSPDDDCGAPTLVGGLLATAAVAQVSCGVQHTVAIAADGAVYAWGGNAYGQLGLGHLSEAREPQRVSFFDGMRPIGVSAWFHTAVWLPGGELYCFGEGRHFKLGTLEEEDAPTPHRVAGPWGEIKEAAAGSEHTCVLSSGRLYMWGCGDGGKLGHGRLDPVPDPVQSMVAPLADCAVQRVAVGVDHTLVLVEPLQQ